MQTFTDYVDTRRWYWYVIPMPVNSEGKGPVSVKESVAIWYQVWNQRYETSGFDYEYLPDAINKAIELNMNHKKENK